MITIVKKVYLIFYRVVESVLEVFLVIVYLLFKVKTAIENVAKKAFSKVKKTFADFLKLFNATIAVTLSKNGKNNFAYARVKADHKNKDYKSLAPPSF